MEGGILDKILGFYYKHYKKFLFLPFILLLIAFAFIFIRVANTGDFINKDISLKGGISLTVIDETPIDAGQIAEALKSNFAPYTISVRLLKSAGQQMGFLIESDIPQLDEQKLDDTLSLVGKVIGKELKREDYSLETMGSSLGKSFFNQVIQALIIAFIFMGLVVFLSFRTFVPSTAVILSALSDIVVTVAIIGIMDIKIGTAGIAALLMLIGYSIDTDILLTTRILKRKDGSIYDAVKSAFITGMTMTLTTIAAVTVGLIFTQSEVIRQIMTILLIGLILDIINTWLQNAGILIWYAEKKAK